MTAYLMLEDGSLFAGEPRGKFKETVCEIVFSTSMTGYVETLSDPSYKGQGIVMSYPIIGNYGVNESDLESDKLWPCAFLVHELCSAPSNFRCEATLEELLIKYDIPCVSGLDTRSIVKTLRENGTMRGIITTDISDKDGLMNKIKAYTFEKEAPAEKAETLCEGAGAKIAVMDFGVRNSFVNSLKKRDCTVVKFPYSASAEEILEARPDGILISNGAGNPEDYSEAVKEIKKLYDSCVPMMGIALGHELMALANGGETAKMTYGNRGANQPVKYLADSFTYVTSQNHGYEVSKVPANGEVSCVNVNDRSIEGIDYKDKPAFSVQFYPDNNEGPRGTAFLFDKFMEIVKGGKCDA